MTKIVSQLNVDGYFVGSTVADESPLEAGVWLIPGGCVDALPPTIPVGKVAKWNGSWVFEDIPKDPEPPVEPEPNPVPISVTRFQARAALYQAGYFDAVTEIMSNPATPMLMKLAWQDAQEFRRDSSTVQALSQILGLTSEQVDQLFIAASGISA